MFVVGYVVCICHQAGIGPHENFNHFRLTLILHRPI